MSAIANWTIDRLKMGESFSFEVQITEQQINDFAHLSGDASPLHMDDLFAKQRGYRQRVAHGVLTLSYFSRIVGMHLPGSTALLQSINVQFTAPVYPGDDLRFSAIVDRVSEENSIVTLKMTAEKCDSQQLVARAKIQVAVVADQSRNPIQ